MAYQEQLADRLRIAPDPAQPLVERRMCECLILLFVGHILCGTSGEDFMLRVGAARMQEALRPRAHAPCSWVIAPQCPGLSGCRARRW